MKFALLVFIALLAPLMVLGAFNDVQLTTGSTIVVAVGGSQFEFTVDSGNVQALNVDAASINFTLAAGSEIHINSVNRKNFNYSSPGGSIASLDCTATYSQLNVSLASGADVAYSVTPTDGACTIPGTTGGGGGNPDPVPTVTTATITTSATTTASATTTPTTTATTTVATTPVVTPEVIAVPAPLTISAVFAVDLARRDTGADVSRLQQLLGNDAEIYPEKLVTGIFGPATERAVIRFQKKYALPAVGKVGPLTRQKLAEVFGNQNPSTGASSMSEDKRIEIQNKIVELQKLLIDLLAKLKVALEAKVQTNPY